MNLQDLFATWELRLDQARRDDRISPGIERELKRHGYELVSAALRVVAEDCESWTKRCDDAKRIPDLLHEKARYLDGGRIHNSFMNGKIAGGK